MLSRYDLQRHGLTLRQLAALGGRMVRLRVSLGWPSALWSSLTPRERKARVDAWLRARYRTAVAKWGPAPIDRADETRSPLGFEGEVAAREVPALARRMAAFDLGIVAIARRRPRPEAKRKPAWFAVRASIAIQIQGETRGRQTVEDRIVILKAMSHEDAEARFRRAYRKEARTYISTTGHLVRWQLVKVVDGFELFDEQIAPEGTEVWSSSSERRLQPEYVWRRLKRNGTTPQGKSRRSTHR